MLKRIIGKVWRSILRFKPPNRSPRSLRGSGPFIGSILRTASEQAKLAINGIICTNSLTGGSLPRSGIAETWKLTLRPDKSGFFGDHLAVFPDVDGSAVHARGFTRRLGRASESTANGCGEFVASLNLAFRFIAIFPTTLAYCLSYHTHTPGVREKTIMVLKIILAPREAPEHNVQ